MSESIKETQEALVAVNEISVLLISRLKDGVQGADFSAVWEKLMVDGEFKAKVQAGYEDVSKIPAEIKDLDVYEIGQLVMAQVSYVPKLVEALK